MPEYVTREDIVAVGATQLTDNYDDAEPGEIEAPSSHIGQIIYSGLARFDGEGATMVVAMRLTGDAITGNPVIALAAYGAGASGTGAGQTMLVGPTVLDVDISVAQGKKMRIFGLLQGTAGDEVAMSVTLVFN